MLTDLIIKNFAIIDKLHVTFGAGFNVLTGETGAGKSIIIDAVGLLLGDRARPDLIRTGEESAQVEALFDLSGMEALQGELEEGGFEAGDELVVKRIVARSGKNKVYINGSLARLAQLQPLTGRLMAIYGQHEHQSLERAETHLALLDRQSGLDGELADYRALYGKHIDLGRRLAELEEAVRERQQRLDLLRFQESELAETDPKPGEEEELLAERLRLQNAERLTAATAGGYETLYGAEEAVCGRLDAVASELSALCEVEPLLGDFAETVRNSLYALEDVATELRGYAGGVSFEPGRQAEVEDRLALLANLKRKYAPTIEEVLDYRADLGRQIEELEDSDATMEGLRSEIDEVSSCLRTAGDKLSSARREAAARLGEAVEAQLAGLAMPKARFEVRFFLLAEPGPGGLERGEFYLSPNPGEEAKPLASIASGGELSRIMLALKRAAPKGDEISSLVFDEVDAGIGGVAATAVGRKLQGVAEGQQVLCITHLPQVAAFADRHYHVEKREEAGRTFTGLRLLEDEEQVLEMARMLGGAQVTDRTREHAREIIEGSRRQG